MTFTLMKIIDIFVKNSSHYLVYVQQNEEGSIIILEIPEDRVIVL